ncbi:hypothetical protein M407DRAFT_149040 [Tulasnella calospora MUT 4182]|uniref:Uncharacterized protein n=1 Tax=Tulasnella calospora MUT 4182 TaxID=1051891 RepID=A0A0C3QRW6_9AGAM|nr:hypothetical protein M407DRAFT_149040 [Tulasnella calospora MUT 4182]
MYWRYSIDKSQIKLSVLARQFTMLGERYGVRPSSLAMVLNGDYNLECGSVSRMRAKLRKGRTIQCYIYFTPDNKYSGVRWSFHKEPPSEKQAAAEAKKLKDYECPKLWFTHRPWSGIKYWQLEDQDLAFYLKKSEDE